MNSVADYFIRTPCTSRAICFQVSLNGIREKNILKALFLKGTSNVPPRKKKKKSIARLNSRGLQEKSYLARL